MRLSALSLSEPPTDRSSFFGDPALDAELPASNEAFWLALADHAARECRAAPNVILDVGCHAGGLLELLGRRFQPEELIGVEPLGAARALAAERLDGLPSRVTLLDPAEWSQIEPAQVDLLTSHEVLYLEADLPGFMGRVRRVLAPDGLALLVLGCHAANPLWRAWMPALREAGHAIYDHHPFDILAAASEAGLRAALQPLRRSGWITYDPGTAAFRYPDLATMLEHHYRHKLLFRLEIADEPSDAA